MSLMVSRRKILALFCAALGQAACAGPSQSLRPVARASDTSGNIAGAEAIISAARLGGRVAFSVADATSGEQIESLGASNGIPPASVTKALTGLYALEALGANHRFVTRVIATGPVSGGIVQGDLILVGGADPTLDTDDLQSLVQTLRQRGIREVRGDFKVAQGALPYVRSIDTSQPDHVGYSPAVSGIALNFNQVHFEWRRSGNGHAVVMQARAARFSPDVFVTKMQIANRSLPVYAYSENDRSENWSVARSALGGSGSRRLPVRKPALYAGDVFQTLARAQGIVLKNPQVISRAPQGTTLATHQSAELTVLVRDMLRYSNNLMAEMIGMAATARKSGSVSSMRSSANAMGRWAASNFGATGTSLVDHSGLGDANRMTANGMVEVLVKMNQTNALRPLLRPISMRDANRRVIENHPIKVDAKTGTLNFVSALAGYMTTPSGKTLAFAIFAADEASRRRITRETRAAPPGGREWNRRARAMQQRLIERWGSL